MKNYKVEAIMKFTDKEENGIKRNVGDIFETTKERYEFLKQNNAVKLIEVMEEPKKNMIFVDTKNESEKIKPLDEEKIKKIADEMIEHIKSKKEKIKQEVGENMSDLGGVWRTVGGRRIFIKDGQDLATAMKESGKFNNKKNKENDLYKNVVQGKEIDDDDLIDVNEIIKKQGFDGKPILIKDEKEFETMLNDDTVGMYRGVRGDTKEQIDKYSNMLRNGEFVTNSDNLSVSGKGLYTASYSPNDTNAKNKSRELAEKYAGFRSMFAKPGTEVTYKDTGKVERFTFTKDVKLYKPKENEKILKDYQIAKKGYDGYYSRDGDFVIILNRTKMIILDN